MSDGVEPTMAGSEPNVPDGGEPPRAGRRSRSGRRRFVPPYRPMRATLSATGVARLAQHDSTAARGGPTARRTPAGVATPTRPRSDRRIGDPRRGEAARRDGGLGDVATGELGRTGVRDGAGRRRSGPPAIRPGSEARHTQGSGGATTGPDVEVARPPGGARRGRRQPVRRPPPRRPCVRCARPVRDDPAAGTGPGPRISESELRELVAANVVIDGGQRQIIAEVLAAGVRHVREVMVPRTDAIFVAAGDSIAVALDRVLTSRHSRFPVIDGTHDDVIGVVQVWDLLLADAADAMTVGALARPVHHIPGSKRVLAALSDMRREGHHMAVVVDEYGGTAGIVTLEDLVEELVGEVHADGIDGDADGTAARRVHRHRRPYEPQ